MPNRILIKTLATRLRYSIEILIVPSWIVEPEDLYPAMQKFKNGYVNDLKPGNKVTLITIILSDITQFLLLNF